MAKDDAAPMEVVQKVVASLEDDEAFQSARTEMMERATHISLDEIDRAQRAIMKDRPDLEPFLGRVLKNTKLVAKATNGFRRTTRFFPVIIVPPGEGKHTGVSVKIKKDGTVNRDLLRGAMEAAASEARARERLREATERSREAKEAFTGELAGRVEVNQAGALSYSFSDFRTGLSVRKVVTSMEEAEAIDKEARAFALILRDKMERFRT